MSQNRSEKESGTFSDLNITRSFKTYSRSENIISPSKKGANKQQMKSFEKNELLQRKKLLESVQRKYLNKETSIFLREVPSLDVNGYGTDTNNFKSAHKKPTKSNGTLEFGKDWDEMEFLGSKSNLCVKSPTEIPSVTVTKKICNGEYARTRRNLVQRISSIDSGRSKSIDERNCSSRNSSSSEIFSISSIISNSPTKIVNVTKKEFDGNDDKPNSFPSEPKTLSLMDMVRKFALNPKSISLSISNPKGKEDSEKEVSSAEESSLLHVSKVSSPSPRENRPLSTRKSPNFKLEVNPSICKSSSPVKGQKGKVPAQRKNGIKTPKSQLKNTQRKQRKKRKCKEIDISISNVHSQIANESKTKKVPPKKYNKRALKRKPDVLDKASKKMKNNQTSLVTSNHFVPNHSSNAFPLNSAQEVPTPVEISNFLDTEMKKSSEILSQNSLNLIPRVLPQNTKLNSVVPSTAFLPTVSLPNTFTNTYVTPDNNVFYSVNPYVPAMQPALPNSQATVLILPVTLQQNSNASQSPPPIYQVNCAGQNVDSIVRNILKSYYPQAEQSCASANNYIQISPNAINSLNTLNISNENVSVNQNVSSAPLFDILTSNFESRSEISVNVLEEGDSDSKFLNGLATVDRNVTLLNHFCELMEKQSEFSLKQCKEQAKKMFNAVSLKELSVETFCMWPDVSELFSNFCFKDSKRKQTNYKFGQDFKNSSLLDVLKNYISEQLKTILEFSPGPVLMLDQVLKGNNSNLSLAEKLLMKKILIGQEGISLRDLIGALFFVGMITVYKEYKEISQKQEDLRNF